MKKITIISITGLSLLAATGIAVFLLHRPSASDCPPAPAAQSIVPQVATKPTENPDFRSHVKSIQERLKADISREERYKLNCELVQLLRKHGNFTDRWQLLNALQEARKHAEGKTAPAAELNYAEGWSPEVIPSDDTPVEVTGNLPFSTPGSYEVILSYKGGKFAGKFTAIELYDGEHKVDEDCHVGTAGYEHYDNIYKLTVPVKLKKPRLFIRFDQPKSKDSYGEIAIVKNELSTKYGWTPDVLPDDQRFVELKTDEVLNKPCVYEVTFSYIRGNDACRVRSVKLCDGDKLVSEDCHEGSAGYWNKNSVYRLRGRSGMQKPRLLVSFDMPNTRNSYGNISLARCELSLECGWSPLVLPSDFEPAELQGPLPISSPGTYELSFNYTKGSHRLQILGVELYDGEVKLAQDFHVGYSGHSHKNNTYLLRVKRAVREPRIFITFDMATMRNSYGNISLKRRD